MRKPPDVSVANHGTIYLLHLDTRRATARVEDHIAGEHQFLGHALAVERRFVADIVCGMDADGLQLELN